MARLMRKEWAIGTEGLRMLHSKRGKSLGVSPWWKRKTVLSGDFVVLGVHILCPSSQQRTQIWKKLVSVACYSHITGNYYSTNSSALFLYPASCFSRWLDHHLCFPPFYCSVWTHEHLCHICSFITILVLAHRFFSNKLQMFLSWQIKLLQHNLRYPRKKQYAHSLPEIRFVLQIQFYFRINFSTPHLFTLSGSEAHTCLQNWSIQSVLIRARRRTDLWLQVFPFLISEKDRLCNSRSEDRDGRGWWMFTCWAEEFIVVSSWWSGMMCTDVQDSVTDRSQKKDFRLNYESLFLSNCAVICHIYTSIH